ncbi:hypothetical protein GC175_12760 [bacterium]|nr:hypothetical protein [bacterium]
MTLIEEVVKTLEELPNQEQQEVLAFFHGLAVRHRHSEKSPKLMLEMAGTIDLDYADMLEAIIEAGCEQVDLNVK